MLAPETKQRILEAIKQEPHGVIAARNAITFLMSSEARFQTKSFTKKDLETVRDQILSAQRFGKQSQPYKTIKKAINQVIAEVMKHHK